MTCRSALLMSIIVSSLFLIGGCEKAPSQNIPVEPSDGPSAVNEPRPAVIEIERAEFPSILLEAESGEIAAPVQLYEDDEAASGGAYVLAPEGPEHKEISIGGGVTYKFEVPEAGDYALWVRGRWCCDCGNSVEVLLDGVSEGTVEDAVLGQWHWVALLDDKHDLKMKPLRSGTHLLVILNREDGAAWDQILLTQDPDYRPSGVELPDVPGRTAQTPEDSTDAPDATENSPEAELPLDEIAEPADEILR